MDGRMYRPNLISEGITLASFCNVAWIHFFHSVNQHFLFIHGFFLKNVTIVHSTSSPLSLPEISSQQETRNMQYQFKHNSGTVRWEKEGGAILQWRSHRFLGNSIKRLYEIVRRAGCCEECEGSRETSAGLDESSISKKASILASKETNGRTV